MLETVSPDNPRNHAIPTARADLIEFIETIILYKLPRLSREEIRTMLQIHDIRESRAYQEAREEGLKEGLKEGIALAIAKMAARKMSPEEIAAILEVNVEMVQQVLAGTDQGQ